MGGSPICALCDEPIWPGCVSRQTEFGLKPVDKRCYNALHALLRLMQKDDELRSSAGICRKQDLKRFKEIAMSLRTSKHRTRTKDQREAGDEFIQEMCNDIIVAYRQKYLVYLS